MQLAVQLLLILVTIMVGTILCLRAALVIEVVFMKSIIIFWILILNTFTLSGCASETFKYTYIVPEAVEDRDQPYRKAELFGLKNHISMPIFYRIEREGYSLSFEVDRKSRHPAIIITSQNKKKKLLSLKGGKKLGCGAFDEFAYVDGEQIRYEKKLRYEWAPGFKCPDNGQSSDQVIVFSILDNNNIIAEENITFLLMENGTYTENDGI